MSDARNLMVVFSPGVTARAAHKLVRAVEGLSTYARRHPHAFDPPPHDAPDAGEFSFEMAMSAPAAFAAEVDHVAWEDAQGRIAAEILAPAPPGIPRLIPGQRITAAHVAYLVANRDAGVFILDPADPTQRRIRVVRR